jgi:hypothetical protein
MDTATRSIDPSLPPGAKLLTGKTSSAWHNRLFWQVFSAAFNYGFYVEREGVRVHTGNAEHDTAPAAEKAAAAFCREWIEDRGPGEAASASAFIAEVDDLAVAWDHAAGPKNSTEEPDGSGIQDEPVSVSGWYVISTDEKGGTYGAELHDPATGVIVTGPYDGADAWSGYETAGAALQVATEWARENPTPNCAARESSEAGEVKADAFCAGWAISVEKSSSGKFEAILVDVQTGEPGALEEDLGGFDTFADAMREASGWAGRHQTPTHQLLTTTTAPVSPDPTLDTLALGESAEVARLRAENEKLRRERDLAVSQREAAERGFVADASEAGVKAAQYQELRERREVLIYEIASRKDRLKGVDEELRILSGDGMEFLAALATGTRAKSYQQTLTFDSSSAVKASVGAQAQQAGEGIGALAASWAFNGVAYTIEHHEENGPQGTRWTTWIKGHRDTTEGYGETYEQAVGHTQAAASVVFENLDPGQAAPAPPVRMPTKKAKLKGHDIDAVTSALESSLSLLDAAESLKVNVPKLEAFLKKQGIVISKHLAKRAGEETPAPKAKRGRKPKAVAT